MTSGEARKTRYTDNVVYVSCSHMNSAEVAVKHMKGLLLGTEVPFLAHHAVQSESHLVTT